MRNGKGFTLIELMIVLAIISITATLVVANLATSRQAGNETAAIKAVRSLQEASSVFKKLVLADADGNGVGEFPGAIGVMIDPNGNPLVGLVQLNSVSHGFVFSVAAGGVTPENTCYADASPQAAGVSGIRSFCQANDGIGYASPSGAAPPKDYLPSDGGNGGPGGDFAVVQE